MTATHITAAAQEYHQRATAIDEQIARIIDGLEAHKAKAALKPADWCFAGDLGYYLTQLTGVADSLHKTGEYAV